MAAMAAVGPERQRMAQPSLVLAVAAVMAAVGLAACGGGQKPTEAQDGPVAVGSGVRIRGRAPTSGPAADVGGTAEGAAGSAAAPAAPAPETGRAVITVRDPRGPTRSGVQLLVEGPVTLSVRSGPDGRAEFEAPPGEYRLTAETGCVDDIAVVRGGTATLGIAVGDVAVGRLTVDAKLRYLPRDGAYWRDGEQRSEGRAGWRPGEVHVVELVLRDPCQPVTAPAAKEGALLGRLRFVPGDGVELAGPPPTTVGAEGRVQVRLRCTGPDVDVSLELVDGEIPTDRIDAFERQVFREQSTPFCSTA